MRGNKGSLSISSKVWASTCPYGAPQFDVKAKKMLKCDGCLDRLEKGLAPVCVESCTQRAIEFGPIDALRKKYGSTAVAPLPPVTLTKPALAVHAPKNARPVGNDSGTVFLH